MSSMPPRSQRSWPVTVYFVGMIVWYGTILSLAGYWYFFDRADRGLIAAAVVVFFLPLLVIKALLNLIVVNMAVAGVAGVSTYRHGGRLPDAAVPLPANFSIDPVRIREALDAMPGCPTDLHDAIESYLSMPDGDARRRKTVELLTSLYYRADRSNEGYAHRAGYNRLRLAIAGRSDEQA